MRTKGHFLAVRVSKSIHEEVKKRAFRKGMTMTDYVKIIIENYLKRTHQKITED